MALDSEWVLTCSSVVTSYGSGQCLSLRDPVPPCESDSGQGLISGGLEESSGSSKTIEHKVSKKFRRDPREKKKKRR